MNYAAYKFQTAKTPRSIVVLLALLAGCGTVGRAPVTDRAAPPLPAVSAVPSVVSQAPLYTVKKGDTLFSIALEHGQDYKDLAAWNNIENPAFIKIGQQLRVTPPESTAAAQVKPVAGHAVVEARPLTQASPNTETLKKEPKGGKQPYSEQAWAQTQKNEVVPHPPADKPTDPAQARSETKSADAASASEDGLSWSWPAGGKLIAGFSEGNNKGVDISGKLGEEVRAAAGGKVVYAGSGLRGYGKLVIVKHNTTYLSAYAHNNQILVKEGQAVSKGQKIAELGNSDADQPKLHFEIRRQGKPVDPLKYLPPR